MNNIIPPKLHQYNDRVENIAKDYSVKYRLYNILSINNQEEFQNALLSAAFTGKTNSSQPECTRIVGPLIIMVVCENLFNSDDRQAMININALNNIRYLLKFVAVCGNENSMDYLLQNDAFMAVFK
jgi:hypothetical protein